MSWQLIALALCLLTGNWFLAVLFALYLTYRWFQLPPQPTSITDGQDVSRFSSSSPLLPQEITDLLILRLELSRQLADGTITREFYHHAVTQIDTLGTETLSRLAITPDSQLWCTGREAAWSLLIHRHLLPSAPPPWKGNQRMEGARAWYQPQQLSLPLPPRSLPLREQSESPPAAIITAPVQTPRPTPVQPLPAEATALVRKTPSVSPSVSPPFAQSTSPPTMSASTQSLRSISPADTHSQSHESYAWKPTTPSVLERALQAVSGWPALIIPFLVQNILWFIGGLCFVAGSIFLVSSTTGFAKGLVVSAVLLIYTLAILWAGYQLRRRQPNLVTASNGLLILGVFLLPLNIVASVRLLNSAESLFALLASAFVTSLVLWGLYHATTLVSGIMERTLQGRHPQIFWGLTLLQLAVPLLMRFPSWPLLAAFHLGLLGLLAYGLVVFARDWLHSIFVERRTVAYYAAGSLVYTAAVSFAHLTWGYHPAPELPSGYYGPLLMTVCALLFFVDAQLKQWSTQVAFLSRISFALYGLSVLALLLSAPAPNARLLTLLLACVLYGFVAWQYQTRLPLLLLLTCVGWLYNDLILRYVPAQWYFFASLPGLASVISLSHWLRGRRSLELSLIGYRISLATAALLAGWSLLHAQPGMVAMGTALTLMACLLYSLRFALPQPPDNLTTVPAKIGLPDSPWSYSITLMGSIAAAYTPLWIGLDWTTQYAFALVLLALLLSMAGLRFLQQRVMQERATSEILLNSALFNLGLTCILTMTLALPDLTFHRSVPLLFTLMGGVLLWLSLALRVQWLFYCVLGTWGVAGAIFKLTYFPAHGAGVIEMLLALIAWTLVWWLDTQRVEREDFRAQQEEPYPLLTLLWRFPVSGNNTVTAVLRVPLRQTMVALWFLGLIQLEMRLFVGQLGWTWVTSATLGALGAVLGAGSFAFLPLLPVAVVLGAGAWLTTVSQLGVSDLTSLSFACAIYAFVVWQLVVFLFSRPAIARLAARLQLRGSRMVAERYIHWTAFALTLLCIFVSLGSYGLFTPNVSLLATLLTSILFFGLSGWRYQRQLQSYLLLGITVLIAALGYSWSVFLHQSSAATVAGFLQAPGLSCVAVATSLSFWLISTVISRKARRSEGTPWSSVYTLYHEPLHVIALILSVSAGNQQLGLAWLHTAVSFSFLSPNVLFLAGVVTVLANHALGHPAFNIIGILYAALGLLWAESWVVHQGKTLSVWPLDIAFTDHWLTLSVIALGLACTALALEHRSGEPTEKRSLWALLAEAAAGTATAAVQTLYIHPLRVVAMLTYGWALTGILSLSVFAPPPVPFLLPCVLLVLTLVAFLLFHSSGWLGFPWLAGLTTLSMGLMFITAGIRLIFPLFPVVDDSFHSTSTVVTNLAHLLWVNLVLGGIAWWQRRGTSWATQWGWPQHEIVRSFLFWPSAFLLVTLLLTSSNEVSLLLDGAARAIQRPLLFSLETALLTLSFFHLWWIRKARWTSHAVLTSCLSFVFTVWLTFLSSLLHLPLLLTLWSAALLLVHQGWQRHQQRLANVHMLGEAVSRWIVPSLTVAFILLSLVPEVSFIERMLTLALLTALTGVSGWQRQNRNWLRISFVLFLLLIHGWPPVWVSFSQALLLLPWYTLLLAVLAWLSFWAQNTVSQRIPPQGDFSDSMKSSTPHLFLTALLSEAWKVLLMLAVLEWGLHGGFLFSSLVTIGHARWFIGTSDAFAALGAALLLFTFGLQQVRKTQHAAWFYAVLFFAGAVGLYLRLLLVGLAPASVWDTVMLMVVTYGMFALYRWTQAEPLLYAVMILPLFTLLTVPLQLVSPHASLTFLTASVLYFLVHYETNRSLPLYLAFVAFNAAIYLWVPVWATHYHAIQMYVIPATLSVLVLLHLHREEVPSHILNSARLAAMSVLYACATYDVFQQESLAVFATMVALSLTGIFVGIALRIRAFLYSGIAFLVLNVLGQLLVHIPEHKLGRAILLLVLGAILTAISVWFSWKREQILQRIRVFRADLGTWA